MNSPQRADEAVHGALRVQGDDVSDVEEAGAGVRHPAAASRSAPAGTVHVQSRGNPVCSRSPADSHRWRRSFLLQQQESTQNRRSRYIHPAGLPPSPPTSLPGSSRLSGSSEVLGKWRRERRVPAVEGGTRGRGSLR